MSVDVRWLPPPGWARDGALVAVAAVLVLVNGLLATAGTGGLTAVGSLVLLIGPALLAVRTRAPRTTLIAELVWVIAAAAVLGDLGPITVVPALVALFTAVAAGHRTFAAALVGSFLALSVAADFTQAGGPSGQALQERFLALGWFIAAGVLGEAYRHYAAYVREVERRAAEARRTHEEAALRRAGEERLRIARELHDSLTHAISIVKVQAGVAVHLARKRGDEVPPALLAIQEASGEATRELRATLEVLRRPGEEEGGPADADDAPGRAPGLGSVEVLVERARAAGITVELDDRGRPDDLPAEVDRAAYRIVQEALTNVARHAPGAAARVRVDRGAGSDADADADAVRVRVDDDGPASPEAPPVPGTGLRGMRERVAALDGRMRAEPRSAGGFRVEAEIPLMPRTGAGARDAGAQLADSGTGAGGASGNAEDAENPAHPAPRGSAP